VTDRKSLGAVSGGMDVLARIRMAIEAGVDWVQIREKDLPGRELADLVRGAVDAARERASPQIMVNDRLDVALAAGAAGVHLGRESVNPREVVHWCRSGNAPAEFRIGVSCHSLEDAREAESAGANYVFFGPVFETPAKRVFGAPQGAARLAEICQSLHIPVMAIGGVDETNALECLAAGAAGIAAIRMFQEARDVRVLRSAVQNIRRKTS
jgi:thiamine-phosphate pyrophosphorylase